MPAVIRQLPQHHTKLARQSFFKASAISAHKTCALMQVVQVIFPLVQYFRGLWGYPPARAPPAASAFERWDLESGLLHL